MKAGWLGLCRAKLSGTVKLIIAGVNIGGTRLVWCTPAMSVSSVTSGVRREWFPLGDKRNFLHVIALSISETTFGAYFRRDV
jgi:hypothetical protein